MSYTGTEIFNRAIAVLDELSETGTVVDSQVKDYKYRAPSLLDLFQHEIPDLTATVKILRKPLRNLLGDRFGVCEHMTDDGIYETTSQAKAAVFTVDNLADVYIENNVSGAWENAAGFYSKDGGEETAFTGLISVAALTAPETATYKCRLTPAGDKTRLRFTGGYYYLFSDFALFEAAFPSCERVPDYGEYIRYAMPLNFGKESQILTESPQSGISHKWENGYLMINYGYEGVIKITYRPNPAKITALTQTLEISEAAAAAGAYFLAMHFAISDMNNDIANLCTAKYQELKKTMTVKKPLAPVHIQDVYNIARIR